MFLAAFSAIKQGVLKQNDDICMFFGGILCGLHKVHNPAYTEYFQNMGFNFLTCCELHVLAGGILCAALNFILPCKISETLPADDSKKKQTRVVRS